MCEAGCESAGYGESAGYEKPRRLSRGWRENDPERVPSVDDASERDDVPFQLTLMLISLILRCSHPSPAGIELEICRIFFCVGSCF